jgi:hypothetical protein
MFEFSLINRATNTPSSNRSNRKRVTTSIIIWKWRYLSFEVFFLSLNWMENRNKFDQMRWIQQQHSTCLLLLLYILSLTQDIWEKGEEKNVSTTFVITFLDIVEFLFTYYILTVSNEWKSRCIQNHRSIFLDDMMVHPLNQFYFFSLWSVPEFVSYSISWRIFFIFRKSLSDLFP